MVISTFVTHLREEWIVNPDKVYGSVLDQLQVVFDQAAFRPWYVNTVHPDPDRTAEEDCQ